MTTLKSGPVRVLSLALMLGGVLAGALPGSLP